MPALEIEAAAARQLRRRVADLEARLRQAEEQQTRLAQAVESNQWQVRAEPQRQNVNGGQSYFRGDHKGQL